MTDFAKLRKNSSIEKLQKTLEAQNTKFQRDERYWQPTVDKAGNGFAVIRFLDAPAVDGDDAQPYVVLFNHGFKGPTGQYYIENSLTTLGKSDPVSEYNSKLWNTNIKANQDKAREQKRRLSYISNILVVKDAAHPENEGKVFLYSYGKKIMDMIKYKAAIDQEVDEKGNVVNRDPEDQVYNPFNFWEGGNFKLSIRKVEGYRNYDKSRFDDKSSPLFSDDKKIEAIWRQCYSLKAEVAPEKFKTYEQLKEKLDRVLGLVGESGPIAARRTAEDVSGDSSEDVPTAQEADAEIAKAVATTDEDEFETFAKLARDLG